LFEKHDFDKNRIEAEVINDEFGELQKEFIEDMTKNAERACKTYNEMFTNALDYSINSLLYVDELLEHFHRKKHDLDKKTKSDIIGKAGSYIFEVARRNFGGKYYWFDDYDQPILVTGQPNFEISIIAFNKVRMRIDNGNDDNILSYFKAYEERIKRGRLGDKVLIT